jgi:sigma-B regulation protein RsbU (phosphoserine phosphatase)
LRVLLVEDDIVSLRLQQKMLGTWGHEVTTCENGKVACELFAANQYDVVVSDWMMPELDGLELCNRIRAIKNRDYCYFILVTARSRRENLIQAMDAGVDDYLIKPVDSVELRVRLNVAERIVNLKSDVRVLQGLLPMCAWCKSIRDDRNLWASLEDYFSSHTSAELTHAICPRCLTDQLELFEKQHGAAPEAHVHGAEAGVESN